MLETLLDTHSLLYVHFSMLHVLLVNYPSHSVYVVEAAFHEQVHTQGRWEMDPTLKSYIDDLRRQLDRLKGVGSH